MTSSFSTEPMTPLDVLMIDMMIIKSKEGQHLSVWKVHLQMSRTTMMSNDERQYGISNENVLRNVVRDIINLGR